MGITTFLTQSGSPPSTSTGSLFCCASCFMRSLKILSWGTLSRLILYFPAYFSLKRSTCGSKKTAPTFSPVLKEGMVTSTTPLLVSADAVLPAASPPVVEVAAEDAAPPQPARLAVIMAAARAPANSCFFFIVFLLYLCAFCFINTVRLHQMFQKLLQKRFCFAVKKYLQRNLA